MSRPPLHTEILRWARGRARYSAKALARRFPEARSWVFGKVRVTLKQLEAFAKATCTPLRLLFLAEPSVERIPITDFRTVANVHLDHPSPDLSDTIQSLPATPETATAILLVRCAIGNSRSSAPSA